MIATQEKEQIVVALKQAYDNTLNEQDIYRDRITAMEECGNKDYLLKLSFIGWKGIDEAMVNECWPATDQDRKELLEQNWDEIPSRILIDQIEDKDISCKTYFLGEVVDQCHRIKAMAKFYEILNANPADSFAYFLFMQWSRQNVYSQLAKEQLEAGNQETAESLLQMAEATKELFDIFAKNPEALENTISKREQC